MVRITASAPLPPAQAFASSTQFSGSIAFGTEGERQLAACFKRLDDQHASADPRCLGDYLEAHHAAGDDDETLPGDKLRLVVNGVEAIGQGLDENGALLRQVFGKPQRTARPRDRIDGNDRVIGIAAIDITIEPVAGAPSGHAAPDRRNAAQPFMSGIERVLAVIDADFIFARVRRADAAGFNLYKQFAFTRNRDRYALNSQIAQTMKAGCSHLITHATSISCSAMRPSSCMDFRKAG